MCCIFEVITIFVFFKQIWQVELIGPCISNCLTKAAVLLNVIIKLDNWWFSASHPWECRWTRRWYSAQTSVFTENTKHTHFSRWELKSGAKINVTENRAVYYNSNVHREIMTDLIVGKYMISFEHTLLPIVLSLAVLLTFIHLKVLFWNCHYSSDDLYLLSLMSETFVQ